jgi:hypothetical protein
VVFVNGTCETQVAMPIQMQTTTTQNGFDCLSARSRKSHAWLAIKWINLHGTSVALMLLLVGACAWAHLLAAGKIEILRGQVIQVDSLSLRRIAGIEYIQNHWWFVLPYLTLFAGNLIWLEARKAPRWAVWVVWVVLAAPCLGYLWACLDSFFTGLFMAI